MNVDRIIALADAYEKDSIAAGSGASHCGLYAALMSAAKENSTEEAGQGCVQDSDAVNISTYHRSKGLEWPIVVLCDMFERWKIKPGRTVFGRTHVLQQKDDPDDVLKGRSLLYIPWPYAEKSESAPLWDICANDPVFSGIAECAQKERERLLYVGMTRGMDMMVFTEKANITDSDKAETVAASNLGLVIPGLSVQDLPSGENLDIRLGSSLSVRAAVRRFSTAPERGNKDSSEIIWFADAVTAPEFRDIQPYRLSPSHLEKSEKEPAFSLVHEGTPYQIRTASEKEHDDDRSVFGTMLHDFFAGDRRNRDAAERKAHAQSLIESRLPGEKIDPAAMIASHDALDEFLDALFRGWRHFKEIPVRYHEGGQLISGIADLVLSDGSSFVLVDYKSFAGTHADCVSLSAKYAPQLYAYAKGLSLAGSGRCAGIYLYYAVSNCMVRVSGIEP